MPRARARRTSQTESTNLGTKVEIGAAARTNGNSVAKSDGLSDDEIKKLTSGMLATTSRFLYSPTGRILRYVALAAIGIHDTATGLALGAVDTFILDKLVPVRGPLSFLDDKYRSIFQDDPTEA